MGKKFIANRYSEGNGTYQTSVTIEDDGLTVRIPGFWKNNETRYLYKDISAPSKTIPLLGFSTIEFFVFGKQVKLHGFTKDEVNEIDQSIKLGQKGLLKTSNSNVSDTGVIDLFDSLINWLLGKPFRNTRG